MAETPTDIKERLLDIMSYGTGQGNTNTNKLTEMLLESDPNLYYTETKIKVVEALGDLQSRGELQIVTINWEIGEEFLYICTSVQK